MRALPLLGAIALFGLGIQPASAQMCGNSGQQAQSSTPAQGGTAGMMCGGAAAAADDPMADKPAAKPKAKGMCACCGKMAMMQGGQGDGMNMPGHTMPVPETPKAQ